MQILASLSPFLVKIFWQSIARIFVSLYQKSVNWTKMMSLLTFRASCPSSASCRTRPACSCQQPPHQDSRSCAALRRVLATGLHTPLASNCRIKQLSYRDQGTTALGKSRFPQRLMVCLVNLALKGYQALSYQALRSRHFPWVDKRTLSHHFLR